MATTATVISGALVETAVVVVKNEVLAFVSDNVRNPLPVALVFGDVQGLDAVPVRIHSECMTSEVFGSLKCDCKEQLDSALAELQAAAERTGPEHHPGIAVLRTALVKEAIDLTDAVRARAPERAPERASPVARSRSRRRRACDVRHERWTRPERLVLRGVGANATRNGSGLQWKRRQSSTPRPVGNGAPAARIAGSARRLSGLRRKSRRTVGEWAHPRQPGDYAIRAVKETTMKSRTQNSEKGQSLVLLAVLMLVFLGMLGFVIDGGVAYANRRLGQTAADAGALRYEMAELDLNTLVCGEAESAKMRASGGIAISCHTTDPIVVLGDEGRLRQVLRNLLDNALRHTDSGEISVTAEVVGPDASVRVEDTGEGIPEEDLPFVFERFYRADSARARQTGGSGIGLAVSRRIMEDHGGQVFAQNRPDGGASVGFTLPLARD